nr:nesprin-2-like isoform X2 [Paramormyrops kingsleyae]
MDSDFLPTQPLGTWTSTLNMTQHITSESADSDSSSPGLTQSRPWDLRHRVARLSGLQPPDPDAQEDTGSGSSSLPTATLKMGHTKSQKGVNQGSSCVPQQWERRGGDLVTGPAEAESGSGAESASQPTMTELLMDCLQLESQEPSSSIRRRSPLWNAMVIDTSPGNQENHLNLSRVAFRILCCQNQPVHISTAAMVQQVDEAKACRQWVLEKLDALPSAGVALETVRPTEGQWKAVLQDASAAVQMKEAQMQLVSQYEQKSQTAEAALAKLKVDLRAACSDTMESMTLQEERLRGFLQNLEQESTTMGAVLQVFSEVSPVLDEVERTGTLIRLEDLQGHWWTLQRVAERALYHATACVQESANLLQEAQDLRKQLKALQASELFQSQSGSCASVQLVIFGATLAAIDYQYDNLNQLFEALNQNLAGETERKDIRLALQSLKEELDLVKTQMPEISISVIPDALSKIMKVMQDHLTWAKQMEIKITEKKRKLDLFPEKVHCHIFELKKLKCEIQSKQIQLESLLEEVKELTPVLDKTELPPLLSLADTLKDLTKSAVDNSGRALLDVKLSLQMKEKLFEQIANVDAWVAKHVEKEMTSWGSQPDSEPGIASRLRHRMAELKEAEKHSAVIMTLLNKAGEMAPQLSLADRCKLHNLLIDLQGAIHGIITSERKGCRELEELRQARVSSLETLASIEAGLRQIDLDLTKHKFPVTKDSLTILEHYRYLLLKHRWQVDRLHHFKGDKRRELQRVMVDLQKKMNSLGLQAEAHGKYLSSKKQMEDWKQNLEKQALQLKDEKINKVERFRSCHILSVQFPLTKNICQEVTHQLNNISQDLYPSQLNSERQKIRHAVQGLDSWEMTIHNDLKILESALLEGKCYFAELHAMLDFLRGTQHKLDHALPVSPDEQAIDRELLWCLSIEKRAESGRRVLQTLKYRIGTRQKELESKHSELTDLIEKVLKESQLRTGSLCQAKEALRGYCAAVRGTAAFFQDAESKLLPVLSEASGCAEELQYLTAALASLTQGFDHHLSRLQELLPLRTCLSVSQVEQIHKCVLSQLLVTLATLQAQAQLHHEALQSCAKRQDFYRKSLDDMCHHVQHLETSLSECVSHKVTSLRECSELQEKLNALEREAESHVSRLADLWVRCPKPGCGSKDEAEPVTLRRRLAGLHRSARYLGGCWERRAAEWKDVALSMERAQKVLEQLEDEIPPSPREGALQEELQNLLPDTETYLQRLNNELCVLASMEMRLPRPLGDPAKKEQDTPSQFSEDLQAIRECYRKLTEKSMLGRQAASAELHDREQVREEIYGMRERLRVASCRLSGLEHFACQSRLQEVRLELSSQRAVLQGIMEGLRVKYPSSFPLVPMEVQKPLQDVTHLLEELEEKLAETAEMISPVRRLGVGVTQVTGGLRQVMSLLEQKSSTVVEAEYLQKRVWDELDRWHNQLAALESEVVDMSQDQPEQAHDLMDQLTEPLQLYQKVAKQAEQRTAFLSKIPACLQEYDEIMASSNSWLREANGWLKTPCTYTSARSLSSHVHTLQVLLEDSEQMRATLQAFTPFLKEISTVCNTMTLEQRLSQADEHVASMQQSIVGPLTQLQNTAAEVDAIETEVKVMEKNVTKIRAILSSLDSESVSPEEHMRDWQVILDNIQAMKRTITEIQNCKPALGLPREAEETLDVFQRAQDLLPPIQNLEQETVAQIATIKEKVWETSLSEEEEESSSHSSSSDTLLGSVSESPDDTAEEPTFPAEGAMGAAGGGGALHGDLAVGAACGGAAFGDDLNVGVLETPEPHLIPATKSAIGWQEGDTLPEPIRKQIFDPHDKDMLRCSTPSSETLKDDRQAEVGGDVPVPPLSVSVSLETDYDSQLSTTIPQENASVSQEALSLLYKRNASLPEETKSVTQDTVSVPVCVVSIFEETMSITQETVSVPQMDVTSPEKTILVAQDTVSLLQKHASAPAETVSVMPDTMSFPKSDVSSTKDIIFVTQDTMSVQQKDVSAPAETISITQETVSVHQKDVSFRQKDVSVPAETKSITHDALSVSNRDMSAPKDSTSITRETVSVPKRDVSAPKETVSAAQEIRKKSIPQKDVLAPEKSISVALDTMSVLQKDVSTPAETISVMHGTLSVSKSDVPTTKVTICVTQETVSVPKSDVSAPKDTTSVTEETVSVPQRDVSASKETTSITPKTVSVRQKDVSVPPETVSETHGTLSTAKRDMSTPKETISVTEETMSVPKRVVSATKETTSVTLEMVSVPKRDVSAPKETIPKTQETVSAPKKDVSATKETTSLTQESVSVPYMNVSTPKETTSVTQETESVSKRDVSAPKETISVIQDTMSVLQNDFSDPVENISVTSDSVSLPKRDVPATKDTPSVIQDIVSVTKETTSVTQETVLGPQGDVSVTHDTLSIAKKDVFTTKETISETKETVSVPKKDVSAPKDTLSVTHETMKFPQRDVLGIRSSVPHKDVSVPLQTVPLVQGDVVIPLEPLAVPPMHVPVSGGPWVDQGLQSLCELTTQVRAWLERAHQSLSDMLPGAPMPGGIEEQLLTCQGACEEMEKNVSSLYSLSPQDVAETHGWTVTLLSTLDQLKISLLPLLPLSEHWSQDQSDFQCGVLAQEGGLEHTVSNPELLTTLKIQSIQQEKELQLELKEQRDLAAALLHYSSQGWLQRATKEYKAQLLTRSSTGTEGDATAQRRRPQVHEQLEATLTALDGIGSTWQEGLASGKAVQPVTWSMPAILRQEAVQLEDLLNTACTSLQSQQGGLQEQLEQQLQYEQRLHGLTSLVELGWERLIRSQHVQLRSQDELQAVLSSHKTFFQKLACHLAMVRQLSQTQAGAQTRAQAALEQDARTLQQRAVQQGVWLQDGLQAWSQWQESCGWIAKLLNDLEARMPSSTGPGKEEQEEQLQQTLCICEQVSRALEESRAPLGAAVEQGQVLQAGGFASTVGAALRELQSRWNAVRRCAEREQLRVSAFTHLWARFCSDSVALGDWLGRAREQLQSWRRRCDATPRQQEHDRRQLANFLDFTKEVEARSLLKASVISTGEQLLQLKRCGDTGTLREQLTQLEQGWAEILSTLPSVQERLHQQLMEKLQPSEAMTELGVWMDAMEKRLKEDHQEIRQASSAAGLQPLLQRHKEYQVEMACHQLTVDTLNQSVLQSSGTDLPASRYEHALHAEKLGALNLRWLHLKGALCSQVQQLEKDLQTCLARDERLRVLGRGLSRQKEKLSQAERPASRWQAREALQECGDTEEKLKDTDTQLQELREACLSDTDGELRPDCACSGQLDTLSRDCADLHQQVTALRPRLQWALDLWGLVTKGLAEVALHTTKSQYTLEQGTHAQFSQHALQDHVDELQLLQVEAGGAEEKWEALNQNFCNLRDVISPAAAQLLSEQIEKQEARRAAVSQEVGGALPRAQELLGLWRRYSRAFMSCWQSLQVHQEQASFLLAARPGSQHTAEQVVKRLEASKMQQQSLQVLQRSMEEVMEASKHLTGHMNVPAAIFIQSEGWMLSCELLKLREALARREGHLQEELEELQKFTSSLASLELHLCSCQSSLAGGADSAPQSVLQDLGSLGPELEALNWRGDMLPQGDPAGDRLQALNRQWAVTFTQVAQAYSELQQGAVGQQSFQVLCQCWTAFLQSMEDSLAREEPHCSPSLREQLAVLQKLRVELPRGDQLLWSILQEGQCLLESLEVEPRRDLTLQLTHMRERWHSVLVRVQQHGSLLRALVRYWQLYIHGTNELRTLLSQTDSLLPPAGPAHCSLRELRRSLQDLKHAEDHMGRRHTVYRQTMQIGWQLCSASDAQTQAQLQTELRLLQEDWERTESLLGKRRALTEAILQNWERYKARLADSGERLEEVRNRLKQPLPECLEEIRLTEKIIKELEEALQHWAHGLTELAAMKTELSQYVVARDGPPPGGAAEDLQLQWEELCAKVSLRKQEIADRLSAWVIFNKKNKELCEWLSQMESKVTHRADISMDDMMEKLKKDFMEEINLFSENKTHLNRLGEQLLSASDQTRGAEVSDKMADVNARWQRLFDHIEARVRQLKETLSAVRQLDMDMNHLRVWLSHTEATLATPVTYSICHQDEIQGKLAEQQNLQRDIEQHAEGVASVLTACEGLLGDSEGCGTETERRSLQEVARCLEQRWRNICTLSLERRAKIDDTWQLWCSFLDDHSHFDDWLKAAEHIAADPKSVDVPYANAKEELKKFEALQRQVQERLAQLERLNKQHRQLAQEQRTDSAGQLRCTAWEVNRRWDELESRVAAILRRLRHFTCQREEFEGIREGLLVWLTEMDLQLTTVEHFSDSDVQDKMRQLNDFQQEITLNTSKIDQLIVFGENLIQKSAAPDAVTIENELEELHSYCQEVFGRVGRFHQRLTSPQQVRQEQQHQQEDLEEETRPARGGGLLSISQERSDRDTPISVESIPLEWDHAVDVGPHQRKEEEEEEEATFYSALSGRSVTEASWHTPEHTETGGPYPDISHTQPSGPLDTSIPFKEGYVDLMSECSGTVASVERVSLILNSPEHPDDVGLTGISAADKQSGVIKRWELLQAQARGVELEAGHDLRGQQQLTSDLESVAAWLGQVQCELERLKRSKPSASVQDMEAHVRQLKEMQSTFASYKTMIISANLRARELQQSEPVAPHGLQEALCSVNQGWKEACASLEAWEADLRSALLWCQEFHAALHSLLLWLAHAESRRFPVDIQDPDLSQTALLEQQANLRGLEGELLSRRQQVESLQEISSQLLPEAAMAEEEYAEARDKVHIVSRKLHALLQHVDDDLHVLQERLVSCPPPEPAADVPGEQGEEQGGELAAEGTPPEATRGQARDQSPPRSFFQRVLRAAFPLHVLFLLLLVLACLVPLSEDDYRCTLSNNFARSFHPMLRYTNGPPPT